jgi:hypothetical protein
MFDVNMCHTLVCFGDVKYFTLTAPAAPVRRSVKYLFSWKMANGAPLVASHTMNTPDPGGKPLATFL